MSDLARRPDWELGGFRIEVALQAASLREAVEFVNRTPLLDPAAWLNPSDPVLKPYKLKAKTLNKATLLSNARWIYQQAVKAGVYQGNNSAAPSKLQLRGMTDVFASFGWNAGWRRPTKSLDEAAWWRRTTISEDDPREMDILRHLTEKSGTDPGMAILFIGRHQPSRWKPLLVLRGTGTFCRPVYSALGSSAECGSPPLIRNCGDSESSGVGADE